MFPRYTDLASEASPKNFTLAQSYVQKMKKIHQYISDDKPLSRQETVTAKADIHDYELQNTRNGLDFSRIQFNTVARQYASGIPVEFETWGPYLSDYITLDGVMTLDSLLPEDLLGLSLD